jgi:hypothetical protein
MNNESKSPRTGFTPVRVIALIIWLAVGAPLSWLIVLIVWFCFFRNKDVPILAYQIIDVIAWLTVASSVMAILFVGFVFASCLLK